MYEIDFNNIKPDDIPKLTKKDILKLTADQFIKYKEAYERYNDLKNDRVGPTLVFDFIDDFIRLRDRFDIFTKVKVLIKDKDTNEIAEYTNCFVDRYDSKKNELIIKNYLDRED